MKKPILYMLLLAFVFQLTAQDIIVSYETVPGLVQTDTVVVYMQSADPNPKEIGAVSFSICFQNASSPSISAIQSDFLTDWGPKFEKSMVHPLVANREGISYHQKLSYGIAAFQLPTFKLSGSSFGPQKVIKIPFTHQGLAKYYLERPNQNREVSVGNAQGKPYDILVVDKAQPFPVEWLYVEAEPREDRKVKVSWATVSETHNDYFSIEKSPNGIDFTEIATVPGTSFINTPQNYEYLDASRMFARTHYRLVQVDVSGRRTYSDVIEVNFSELSGSWLTVYPNPAKDFFVLEPLVETEGLHHFRLIDIHGALVLGHDWKPIYKKMQISLDGLSSGVYILQTKDKTGKVYLLRLVKK